MKEVADIRLKLMARTLQEHINLANELDLSFAAQLLSMAAMEITIHIHGISEQEVDALCERIEEKSFPDKKPSIAPVLRLRAHDRRSRTRRKRVHG